MYVHYTQFLTQIQRKGDGKLGSVKIDINAKERKYTETYHLGTLEGVKSLLRDRRRIGERRYKGDVSASDIIIDLHSAIESAGLTDRQTEVLTLISWADATQTEAARALDITQQAVQQAYDAACERIRTVYERWNYGAISVDITEITEATA
jgi:DNA-directed RNA polymerase specialized sigma subunit